MPRLPTVMPYAESVELIEQLVGVTLMEEEIARTLLPFARARGRALGLRGADDYLQRLEREPREGREWSRLIAAITNGQTCFFRDGDQFATLERLLWRRARERPGRPVAIWSSACSTGEEPYSLAILCAELGVPAQIVASDVNPASLDRAKRGRYRSWTLRNVSEARLARWFIAAPEGHQLTPQIRSAVRFVRHNLVRDPPLLSTHPDGLWDIVLCRNVLIYFRRERVARVCEALARSLADDGALVVAASETLSDLDVGARPEMVGNRVVYRKAPATPPRAAAPATPRSAPAPRSPGPSKRQRAGAPGGLNATLDRVARMAIDGRVEAARAALERSLAGTEPSVEAHLVFGHLDLCEHDLDGALESYARACETDFLLCEVHYFLGLVHRKRSEWPAAADALRRALFLAPTFWQASYLLAGTYQRLGRHLDAARERARTRRLLRGPPPIVGFISHPLFVERFGVDADQVRRLATTWKRRPSTSS